MTDKPAPAIGKPGASRIPNPSFLDSGFRRNDKSLRDNGKIASPEGEGFQPSPKGTLIDSYDKASRQLYKLSLAWTNFGERKTSNPNRKASDDTSIETD